MSDDTLPKKKPDPLWGNYGATYAVEKYDFQKHTRRNPPEPDADPIIIPIKKSP